MQLIHAFCQEESGFIVSSELLLIATIAVLSMIVGLTEVAYGVNQELEDIGSAFGAVNQSFSYNGVSGHKGSVAGSVYGDNKDFCDFDTDIVCNSAPVGEASVWGHRN